MEKGYALPRDSSDEDADPTPNKQHFRQWLSLANLDAGLSYLMMMFVSLAFLTIGSITLGTAGPDGGPLVPAREETTNVLSRMLTVAAGPLALYIFLIAALAILSSTIIGLVDGKARALRTAVHIIVPRSRRFSDLTWYRLAIASLCLIIFALLFTRRTGRLDCAGVIPRSTYPLPFSRDACLSVEHQARATISPRAYLCMSSSWPAP